MYAVRKTPVCIDPTVGLDHNRSQFSDKWSQKKKKNQQPKNKETQQNTGGGGVEWYFRWRNRGRALAAEGGGKRDDVEKDKVRVRRGDVGAVDPSSSWPEATGGVKLLTRVWTAVSSWEELHQGNETLGFYYGPRCIMGGQRKTFAGNRFQTM